MRSERGRIDIKVRCQFRGCHLPYVERDETVMVDTVKVMNLFEGLAETPRQSVRLCNGHFDMIRMDRIRGDADQVVRR